MGFLNRLHSRMIVAPAAASSSRSAGIAENDARGPMTNPYWQNRMSEPGGRGTVGTSGYVAGQVAFATQSDMSPSGVGGNVYLPWVTALTQQGAQTPGEVRRRVQGQTPEQPAVWTHQMPAAHWGLGVPGMSGWQDLNTGPAPARIPHQFRPALRMWANPKQHGQSNQTHVSSGLNDTNAFLPPANLLGGNSVSRFPRSMRLASGTGNTTNGAGTSYVPAIFVPRGVQ